MNVTRIPWIVPVALAIAALAATPQAPPEDWLGKSPDQVIAKFGLPDDYTIGAGVLEFIYKGKDGKQGKFAFAGDVAIAAPAAKFAPARIRPAPKDDVYVGEPIGEAIKVLGQPVGYSFGASTVQARYPDGTEVLFVGGRVFPK